jgi:hypothetical protein
MPETFLNVHRAEVTSLAALRELGILVVRSRRVEGLAFSRDVVIGKIVTRTHADW